MDDPTPTAVALPMFPLQTVLFPGEPLPLHVFEERYRDLVVDVMTSDRRFGTVLIARGSEVGGGDERLDLGTVADLEALSQMGDGRFALVARGLERIRVDAWLDDRPYPRALVRRVVDDRDDVVPDDVGPGIAAVRRARALLSELRDAPALPEDAFGADDGADIAATCWRLCAASPLDSYDRQRLLAAPSVRARLALLEALCADMATDLATLLAHGEPDL